MKRKHSITSDEIRELAERLLELANSNAYTKVGKPKKHRYPNSIREMELIELQLYDSAKNHYIERRKRQKYIPQELLGEPVWDILLDLFIHRVEKKHISVTSACIASQAPPTTALRYINELVERNIISRSYSKSDRRISYLELSVTGYLMVTNSLKYIFNIETDKAPDASYELTLITDSDN